MKICLLTEAKTVHSRRWAVGLARAGCEVHLISAYAAELPGVTRYRLPIYSPGPVQQIINNVRLNRLLKKIDPEVIHLFGLFSVFSLGSMGVICGKKNLITSVWDSDVVPTGDHNSFKVQMIKKYLLKHSPRLVATSTYLAKETRKYIEAGKTVDVLPWGVDLDIFYPSGRKSDNGKVRIGFAKRLDRMYDADTLLRAFHYAHQRSRKKLLLKIAGNGSLESALRRRAAEIHLDDSIDWLNWLDRDDDMKDFYDGIDIFMMPSRRESFGMAAVEASASGLPVIASRFGGIPEIVIDNETGILVEPEDIEGFGRALLKLIDDDGLRYKMGRNGRARIEKEFDWKVTARRMIALYRQVIDAC